MPRAANRALSPWTPFEDRRHARALKRDAVIRTAAELFVEKGYQRTTLAEVAERLNITKPALFNYFTGKEEILFACFRLAQDAIDAELAAIEAKRQPGLEKVRAFIRAYTEVMTRHLSMTLARVDDRAFSDGPRRAVRRGKRRLDDTLRRWIAEGVADGSIAPCDPKMAAFAVAGALNWIGFWYSGSGALQPAAIADSFAGLLIGGLAPRHHGPVRRRGTRQSATTRQTPRP